MTIEEAIIMIEKLKEEKEVLIQEKETLTSEKQSYTTLCDNLKNEKEELSKQVISLKDSNMKYFERLTFQNTNLKDEKIQEEEEKTMSLDDVVNSFL